jgi:hypothetical protein
MHEVVPSVGRDVDQEHGSDAAGPDVAPAHDVERGGAIVAC